MPTPTTEHSAGRFFAAPIRLVVSGGFAADGRSPDVGTYWYLHDAPQPSIRLRAEPVAAAEPVVMFEAIGYPLGRGSVRDWDMGWYSRTGVGAEDSLPLPPGCWRVKVVGRPPNDALVYDVPATGRPAVPRP